MNVVRATMGQLAEAQLLLSEYYAAINVTKRDSPEEIEQFLSIGGSGLWIVYMEQIPAGCVVLRPLPSIARAAECKRLYVRPQFRGQGLAAALLNSMEEYAAAENWDCVYLDSKDDLRDAIRIYLRRGYRTCDRYNENPQATIFLRKYLR